ncbi:MAG: M20/M25/M40 family metallo-hydrolase [Planctomycetota bacterium]|nr:MAG: M20/M25/M40 family metallo-hydrolase [Planctomycetota bacterium]
MIVSDSAVVDYVRQLAADDRYGAYLRNTLLELVAFNTLVEGQPADIADREGKLFDWVEREVRDLLGGGATIERAGIDLVIATDDDYTAPGYAIGSDGREISASDLYADRCNLVVTVPGNSGGKETGTILQTNVDDAGPWLVSRSAGERVFGRGAGGSKAQIALLLAQMKLLREVEEKFGKQASRGRVYQFVIDGQAGGNGALSLASDSRFAGIPVLMHRGTGMVPCCGHPGELWYRCRLGIGKNEDTKALELFPFVVMELEAECRRLQDEIDHPMFSAGSVRNNHGVLGSFGSSPDRVCDHVAVEITALPKASADRVGMKLIEFLDDAVMDYVGIYGDKVREKDPATGKAGLDRHFELKVATTPELQKFRIDIYGVGGHMDSAKRCDNAVTKASYLLGGLIRIAPSFPGIRARARLVGDPGEGNEIVLEGVQRFSTTHKMDEVKERLTAATQRGVQQYCQIRSRQYDQGMVQMSFAKRQVDAYVDSADNALMRTVREALAAVGEPVSEPAAFGGICDARIYHRRGNPVAIFGAGTLQNASSDDEFIDIPELQKALAVSTLATWEVIQ